MEKPCGGVGILVAGIVIGGVAGLLLAPKKGKELREDIRVKAEEVSDKFGDTYSQIKKEVGEKYHVLHERIVNLDVETMKTNTLENLNNLKAKGEELIRTARANGNAKSIQMAEGVNERINRKIDILKENREEFVKDASVDELDEQL